MVRVTDEDKIKINKLYAELHTYASVARATGFSPATVKKYVVDGYTVVDEASIIRFDGRQFVVPAPEVFGNTDWGHLCVLTEQEVKDIEGIWKEIEI